MNQMSEAKLALVKGLIEQAPDVAIQNLLLALQVRPPPRRGPERSSRR